MRDTMRQRSYDWEDDLFGTFKTKGMEAPEVEKLVAKFAELVHLRLEAKHPSYTRRPCTVTTKSRGKFARGGTFGVTLPPWAWNPTVIAHEVAHWAQRQEARVSREAGEDPGHGPHWLGWYLYLLRAGVSIPTTRMVRSALFYGLKIAPKDLTTELTLEQLGKRKGLRARSAA
jgi:hypothetical protein